MSRNEWAFVIVAALWFAGGWKPVAWAVCKLMGWC
jgi:hypothetical protein